MDKSVRPFRADCDPNSFDRSIQNKMTTQKALKKWCIISTERSQREVNQFQSTIKQCLDQFHFNADRPHSVTIRGRDDDWKSWETAINNTIKPGVDFCVFILPGAKGKGKCYNEIKR